MAVWCLGSESNGLLEIFKSEVLFLINYNWQREPQKGYVTLSVSHDSGQCWSGLLNMQVLSVQSSNQYNNMQIKGNFVSFLLILDTDLCASNENMVLKSAIHFLDIHCLCILKRKKWMRKNQESVLNLLKSWSCNIFMFGFGIKSHHLIATNDNIAKIQIMSWWDIGRIMKFFSC